jgi:hypothetical protein
MIPPRVGRGVAVPQSRSVRLTAAVILGFNAATLLYGLAFAAPAMTHPSWGPRYRATRFVFALAFIVPSAITLAGFASVRGGSRRRGAFLISLGGLLWLAQGHLVLLYVWGGSFFRWPWNPSGFLRVALAEAPCILVACLQAVAVVAVLRGRVARG